MEKQSAQVIDREVEVSSLRRRICMVEEDKEQDKKLISYLQSNLANARNVSICGCVFFKGGGGLFCA